LAGAPVTLRANVVVRVGDFEVTADFEAPAGAVTAVLGPNGAGKTTVLRCIAGALPIDSGAIELRDEILDAPPDRFVAPDLRRIGIVHQRLFLFPHLSARDNVAFGPRARRSTRTSARTQATDLLTRVGLADQLDQKPSTLSGGQAQRVALARALAADPAALLLDEPFAALDAASRPALRRDVRAFLADFAGPTLLVTHDPIDALALADRVVVLEHGRVTQSGAIADVTARPATRYVADLLGINFLVGRAEGTTIHVDDGPTLVAADENTGPVFVTVAPSAIALHRAEPEGSSRNRWRTQVEHLEPLGQRVRVQLGSPLSLVAEITTQAIGELAVREGDEVWVSLKATEITTYRR
jgi:molybdate transport system ATP-binding protein